jgi:hypothetical protein
MDRANRLEKQFAPPRSVHIEKAMGTEGECSVERSLGDSLRCSFLDSPPYHFPESTFGAGFGAGLAFPAGLAGLDTPMLISR